MLCLATKAMKASREPVTHARRIVIKVGTRVATEGDNAFSTGVVGSLVRQVASLAAAGAPDARSPAAAH